MAIRSGFFNSINGDRKYDASRFAEYFASFIGNGVFPNPSDNLQVIANNNMTITVKPGKAWINGYILINDDDYILEIEPADGVLNRIDRVVARYDTADREIRLEVKKGSFASSPVAPTLQRDADAYELALADIYIAKGAVSITQANITDLRLNTELCGIVHGVVDQVDTTTLFNQYLSWYQQTTEQADADLETMKQQFQAEFDAWFAGLKDILDENTAANLFNLINQVESDLASHKNDLATHIGYAVASGTDTYTATIAGITTLTEGLSIKVKFQNANTGACTLNINGLGAKPIKKANGNDLSAGNIKAGQICHLVYNGVNFQLLGEGGEYGTAQPEHVLEGYTIGTEDGIVQGTMPNQGKVIITPGTTNIIIPRGFHNGEGYVEGSPNLIPENIKEGVNVFGVIGTLIPLRSASGSKDITSTHTTISGLPFRPKFIVLTYNYWTGSNNNIFESILVNFRTFYIRGYTIRHYGTSAPSVVDTAPFTSLYDDGFEFRLPSSYADTIIANKCQATWYAWG